MTIFRCAVVAPLAILIASCGGGGGSSDPIVIPGNDGAVSGGACQNEYYREIIGTYEGVVVFEYVTEIGEAFRHCEWTITARVEVDRELAVCSLRMETESDVVQNIVLANDDPQAYQCIVEEGVRSLYDPNQSSSPASFDEVTFPVFMGVEPVVNVPRRGPYFGDPSVEAEYRYLFDGAAKTSDGVRFDGAGGLELVQTSPSPGESLTGTLTKE